MPKPVILIVEDTASQAMTYEAYLKSDQWSVERSSSLKEAREKLSRLKPALIFLDLKLPDGDGMDLLRESTHPTKVIVMTADGSLSRAVEAMKEGAYDFLVKPFPREKMLVSTQNALKQQAADSVIASLKNTSSKPDRIPGFIGSSVAMQPVYKMIESAAPSRATVFITGESGTGKEVCARAIHDLSPRVDGPFVAINCGAIPHELMESEIFGHVKGAFTGATADRMGAARRADGGTLFLDEICEMDLELQVKLLRFLQTGIFTAVGAEREEHVDIRILCATNKNPLEEVQKGTFREDLYYRLHVVSIHLPPLNQREEDIVELAQHFLRQFSSQEGKHFTRLSEEAKRILKNYSWPGNVRQLLNVIQNVVVMQVGEVVEDYMLPPLLQTAVGNITHPLRRKSDKVQGSGSLSVMTEESIRPLWEVEKEVIENAIRLCGGNIAKAAARLEINPSTIYRKKESWEKAS